jgi:hypothetical protein
MIDALDQLQELAEIATVKLAPYVICFDRQTKTYRVVKFCRTGESHMGCFIDREAAEDYLLSRLPRPAATRVEP